MRTLAAFTVAAVLAALPACNSGYIPQARGRVAMIMQGGGQVYVRDGQIYRHGFLGSGLRRAVAGNPAAERAAREYHDRQKDGLLLSTAGLICSMVAAARMGVELDARNNDGSSGNDVPTAAWVSLGCLAASMVGVGYIVSAEPYRYDAINIFNDTTPAWTPSAPGQITQRADAPTLRMR
jgi:hypothetical protein